MSGLIERVDIQDADVGIRMSNCGDFIVRDSNFQNVGTAIDIFDPQIIYLLGLPATVSSEHIADLVARLKRKPNATNKEIAAIVSRSLLARRLGSSELLLKVTSGFIALARTEFALLK